jgi:hypothetical protein
MNEQIVTSQPAKSRQLSDPFVRQMGSLAPPIDDLRGSDRKGAIPFVLNVSSKAEGGSVKECINLAVVMEVQGRRTSLDLIENGPEEPLTQREGPMELIAYFSIKIELPPDGNDISHAQQVEPNLGCPGT